MDFDYSPKTKELQARLLKFMDDYMRRYCERTGLATVPELKVDWNFYLAYNLFRIAAILQGIAKRVEAGTASSAQAAASGAGARPMAELAWKFAQKA
jgi:aminoglycoside phosphotransferase (APT) family kinase protein